MATKLEFEETRSPFSLQEAPPPASKPAISRVPPSVALASVMAFLPQLQQSNEVLAERLKTEGASKVDIEAVPKGAPHISMTLGVGVFDAQPENTPEEVAARTEALLDGLAGGKNKIKPRKPLVEECTEADVAQKKTKRRKPKGRT